MPDIYLPNDRVDGNIVVASTWLRDDDADDPEGISVIMTLELRPFVEGTENYRIVEYLLKNDEWTKVYVHDDFFNIVPAAAEYQNLTGCW